MSYHEDWSDTQVDPFGPFLLKYTHKKKCAHNAVGDAQRDRAGEMESIIKNLTHSQRSLQGAVYYPEYVDTVMDETATRENSWALK